MSQFNTNVVYKLEKEAKGGSLEIGNLYFLNVPVTYAKVLAPAKKYNSDDTAYSLNVFIDQESMDKLEEIGINKQFAKVGVTKIAKGQNRGKFKYPLDVEANAPYAGMFAAQLSRDTVKRDANGAITKEYAPLKVVDAKGKPFELEVGNGSICDIKCFAYRNQDGMLVVMLDTVVVKEHVVYNRAGNGEAFDDILGISVQVEAKEDNPLADFPVDEPEAPAKAKPAQAKPAKVDEPAKSNEIDFDPDIPF